ncbi:MAG: hypothetical protein K5663_10955 [Clostridiales bacterium]|nr:hypothetical protein [Clostridiales bacterium]
MDQRLTRILTDTEGSDALMPFMWVMTGADTLQMVSMLQTIKSCGMNAACVESRTFDDFAKESWWPLITAILEEARRLNMRVWILDDTHYPTGYATGEVDKHPEKRQLHLAEFHTDVIGPRRVQQRLHPYNPEDRLLGAVAVRRGAAGEELEADCRVLKVDPSAPYFSFSAPEGVWRIFQLWLTHEGAARKNAYINMLDPESVKLLVDAVYEQHYQHLSQYFGKELAGFFSDEPSFGNTFLKNRATVPDYHHKTVGMPGLALPWRYGLEETLSQKYGADIVGKLPLLWYDGDGSADVRDVYMDVVSALYSENFSKRLGNWCRERNVEYIGHIIEDNNSHCRLGGSPGHYFRGLEGQDMAGLDVVLTQILPGFVHTDHCASVGAGYVDPLFYSFTLPKLGVSLAHLRPHMRNRTMCEIFGAYGWGLDVPTMKWLVDHFLVFGVNRFVPHAFSPIYPNPDCPPHFQGGGQNPQFEDFKTLMRYTGRMIKLLDGNRVPEVAVLYHAEMEWSGRPFMLDEYVEQTLTEAQIDYDLVPADDLESPQVRDGIWSDGNASFRLLIVPQAQSLPRRIIDRINALGESGVQIVQVNTVMDCLNAKCVALERLPEHIEALGLRKVKCIKKEPYLRVLQVRSDGADIFMLFNESVTGDIDTLLRLPVKGRYSFIDLLGSRHEDRFSPDGTVPVRLSPFESAVLAFGETGAAVCPKSELNLRAEALRAKWEIALADCEDMDTFVTVARDSELMAVETLRPGFAGKVRYTSYLSDAQDIKRVELKGVGDTAQLIINGRTVGRRICPPYSFLTKGLWQEGENTLTVLISTTLGGKQPDRFSDCMVSNPPGLEGPVIVYR